MHTYTGRHLKEKILWGNIISSEMGKQNINATKVYKGSLLQYCKEKTCFALYPIPEKFRIKKRGYWYFEFFVPFVFLQAINGGENKHEKD